MGCTLASPESIANAFAEHFSSVFTSDGRDIGGEQEADEILGQAGVQTVKVSRLTEPEVQSAIKKLKAKRSLGPDGIPAYIYKGCGELLAPPLTHIYNLCISKSVFPRIWKMSAVTSIPKTEMTDEIAKHRPIALLPIPEKIFESVIYEQLFNEVKSQITTLQQGFYPQRGGGIQTRKLSQRKLTKGSKST